MVPSRGTPHGVPEDEAHREEVGPGWFAARSRSTAGALDGSGSKGAGVVDSAGRPCEREREVVQFRRIILKQIIQALNVYVMEGMEDNEEHDMVVNETFSSEEEGYKYYNAYAKSKGFGVRKEELTKKPGTDIAFRRLYVCSKEGYRARKHFEKTKRKRTPRPLSRCGCGARMEIEMSMESGEWFVKDFVVEHNHPLAIGDQTTFIRSHRGLNDAQKADAIEYGIGGLRTHEIMEVMEKQHGGPEKNHPRSVITDGDHAMARAISKVFPNADHRLCSWHIEQNMIRHLRKTKLSDFRKFVYYYRNVDEFESRWADFLEEYEITEKDAWINRMYELRKKWSRAYTKDRYFLRMQSNQRSESLNSRIHKNLDRRMSLADLLEHTDHCLWRIRKNEAELDARASQTVPFTELDAEPLLRSSANIYTPVMFKKVKQQIDQLPKWGVAKVTKKDAVVVYVVAPKERRDVIYDVKLTMAGPMVQGVNCRCLKMETEEIPCTHIFSVLKFLGLISVPRCCISRRWTMLAKPAFESERKANMHDWSEWMDRYHNLRNRSNLFLFNAASSPEKSQKVMDTIITWMQHMHPIPEIRAGRTVYMERASRVDLLVRDGRSDAYNRDVRNKNHGTGMGKVYISHDMICLPVNYDNIHWYVVNVNPEERLIQVLDSMRKETKNFKKAHPELEKMLKGMEAHLDVTSRHDCEKSDSWSDYAVNSWPVQVVKNVPQQKDGISCGLYALKNMANWIGHELSQNFTQADIDKFRKELPALIVDSPLNEEPRQQQKNKN
ncbi:hypothetical protein ACQ4PT_025458 [Festuca glaucescens]